MSKYMIRKRFFVPKDEVMRDYRYSGDEKLFWMFGYEEEVEEE